MSPHEDTRLLARASNAPSRWCISLSVIAAAGVAVGLVALVALVRTGRPVTRGDTMPPWSGNGKNRVHSRQTHWSTGPPVDTDNSSKQNLGTSAIGEPYATPLLQTLATYDSPGCRKGRELVCVWEPTPTDVVIIPALKAVYVDNVKAASEAIRDHLKDTVNASWSDNHGQEGLRTTTMDLTAEQRETYKFFSFVRDPYSRYRSSYEQALCRPECFMCHSLSGDSLYTPSINKMSAFLMSNVVGSVHKSSGSWQDHYPDEHFQTQMSRLCKVPMHFIGRVETFNEDWTKLMGLLGVDKESPVYSPPGVKEHVCATGEERKKFIEQQRNLPVSITERLAVNSLYERDFECLGYQKTEAFPGPVTPTWTPKPQR